MRGAPYKLLRRLLFTLPPETAHHLAIIALRARLGTALPPPPPALPATVMGIRFANRLGLAAGFDKNAANTDALSALGFGFIEVGAITPQPQAGNPRPRVFRLPRAAALINRMGFNNCGMTAAAKNLAARRGSCIIGINLGKNAATSLADAAGDYRQSMRALYTYGDFFTLNISSPNTAHLRDLQTPPILKDLLHAVADCRDQLSEKHGRRAPLVVKLSPDVDDNKLATIADTIVAAQMDGVTVCNTTVARPEVVARELAAAESGGLSGAPLTERALCMTQKLRAILPKSMAIIGTGGIMNENDARLRLQAGADLIQIYTGLVYAGPCLPRQILTALSAEH